MDEQQLQQKIQHYLQNKNDLYQDWYKNVYYVELEPGMQQVALPPSLEELKIRFQGWYKQHADDLKILFTKELNREIPCQLWQSLRKKDPEHIIIHLVGHFTITGAGHLLGVDAESIGVTMTILVTSGYIDRLCDSRVDKQDE